MPQIDDSATIVATLKGAEDLAPMVRERFQFNGSQQKLAIQGADPNYHYHWANDYPGRVMLFESAGYTFVSKGEVALFPGVTPRDNELGDRVSAIVGRNEDGSPLKAFLMKKQMVLYLEDQKRGQERPDAVDAAIRAGRVTNDTAGKDFYVPKSGIRLDRKV